MNTFLVCAAFFLVAILFLGLVRVIKGPSSTDRMLSAQLLGTTGVAILILLSVASKNEILLNVALALALLSPISLISYIHIKKSVK